MAKNKNMTEKEEDGKKKGYSIPSKVLIAITMSFILISLSFQFNIYARIFWLNHLTVQSLSSVEAANFSVLFLGIACGSTSAIFSGEEAVLMYFRVMTLFCIIIIVVAFDGGAGVRQVYFTLYLFSLLLIAMVFGFLYTEEDPLDAMIRYDKEQKEKMKKQKEKNTKKEK